MKRVVVNHIRLLILAVLPLFAACGPFSNPPDTSVPPPQTDIVPSEAAGRVNGDFAVSNDGAATYKLPLTLPKGRNDLQPELALQYDSRAGDGPLGRGWSVSGLSEIARCNQTIAQDGGTDGVHFDARDRFCLDGERLVAVAGEYGHAGTEYRTVLDALG